MIRHLPKIIEFLGYDPVPEPTALHARIAYARRRLGITQKQLAHALDVDAVTLYRWEHGHVLPSADKITAFQRRLGSKFQLARRQPS
jgi:transcriptional regulator with XRE-family HTH domain